MAGAQEHSTELTIVNRMGFHVRPVQRFAELARAFRADVEVVVRGRRVPGKSPMNLMSLGGKCGDKVQIHARGEDARQCAEVLKFLGDSLFFVEDDPHSVNEPGRHVCRLAYMASCFESEIRLTIDGATVDAKRKAALQGLNLLPSHKPSFHVEGPDAAQARAIVENLVSHCFYVEDEMTGQSGKAGA